MIPSTHPHLLGFDVYLVASVIAAVMLASIAMAIYTAITIRDPMLGRLKALNERREQLKAGIMSSGPKKRASLVRKNERTEKLGDALGSMKMLQDSQLKVVHQKLAQMGDRNKDHAMYIVAGRIVVPILLGGLVAYAVYASSMFPLWSSFKRFAVFAVAVIVGYKGPDIWLSNKISKRTNALRKGLPDALDLLVICAEAGLTVDAAFGRVARELGRAYPELADEFALTAIELSFLTERRQAFENLAYRVNLDNVRGVVTTMIQTEKYGTPLASALRVLSAEFRNERMMRAEEKAARLPAIMTIPLILFILPTLFVVILGPAACSIADAFSPHGAVKGNHG